MGQKINPVSLRLQYTNRNFDNCWYSNYFYKNLANKDIFLKHYLDNFLKLLKLSTGRYSIQHLHKKTQVFNFFCYSKSTREWRTKLFGLVKRKNFLKKNRYFFKKSFQSKKIKKKYTNFFFFYNTLNQFEVHKIQKKITSFQNFQLWSVLQKTKYPIQKNFIFCSFLNKKKNHHNIIDKRNHFSLLPVNDYSNYKKEIFSIKERAITFPQDFTKFLILKKHLLKKNFLEKQRILEHSRFLQINNNFNLSFLQNLFIYKTLKNSLNNSIIKKATKKKKFSFNHSLNPIINSNEKVSFNSFQYKYKNYLESMLSSLYNHELDLIAFKLKNDWQHANYLADEITYFLEKRVPFRRLKKKIFKELSKISTIRGVRITCSGRVGGKSKKAQRSKTECIKYGQTSLQVFSSKIDFSKKTAFTSFGSVGVKVWICYY